MNETKNISSSITIQASVIAGILGVIHLLKSFGIDIDFDEGQITELVLAFGVIISAGVAFWGRLKATHKLS